MTRKYTEGANFSLEYGHSRLSPREKYKAQQELKKKIAIGILSIIISTTISAGIYSEWPYISNKLNKLLQGETTTTEIDQTPADNSAIPSDNNLQNEEDLPDSIVSASEVAEINTYDICEPHTDKKTGITYSCATKEESQALLNAHRMSSGIEMSAEEFETLLTDNGIVQNPDGTFGTIDNSTGIFHETYGPELNLIEGEIPEENRILFVPLENVQYLPKKTYSYNGPEGVWQAATTKPKKIILHWDGQPWDGKNNYLDAQNTTNSFIADTQPGRMRKSANFIVSPNGAYQLTPMAEDNATRTFGAKGYNTGSINIETTGSYYDENLPPNKQTNYTISLIKDLMKQYNIELSNLYGHFQLDLRVDGTDRGKPDPGPGYLAFVKLNIYLDEDFRYNNENLFENITLEELMKNVLENCSVQQINKLQELFPDLDFEKLSSVKEQDILKIINWGNFPTETGSIPENEQEVFATENYLPEQTYSYKGEVLRAVPKKIVIHWNGTDISNIPEQYKNDPMVTYRGLMGRTNDKENPWKVATHFSIAGENVIQMLPMGDKQIVLGITSDNHYDNKGNLLPDNQVALTFPAIHIETQGSNFDETPPPEIQTQTLVDLIYKLLKKYHLQIKDVTGHNEFSPFIKKPDPGPEYLTKVRIELIKRAIEEENNDVLGNPADWEFYSLQKIDEKGTTIAVPTDKFPELIGKLSSKEMVYITNIFSN